MIKRIVHASDFSPASRAAFARAVELAKTNRAELVLVHVLAPVVPLAVDGYVSAAVYEDMDASARKWAKGKLAGLADKARAAGVRVRAVLRDGQAHEQIVRAARSARADLLVLGTHGRSGLARFFVGSVAGRVVATARCPVLTVRGR